MSRIDELLEELCPAGVEHLPFDQVGSFKRGGGPQKKDFQNGGIGCIHYGQIYTFYGVHASEANEFVSPDVASKSRMAQPNDVVIAVTGENDDDLARGVAWLGCDSVAVSNHTLIFTSVLDPRFVSYFLRSATFDKEKRRYITGTKVRSIPAKAFSKIRIPVPPLEVQREIVKILDTFTQLEAELEAELEARRQQYEHYRDKLLTFPETGGVRRVPMGELGTIFGGLTGKSKADFTGGNARFISYVNIFNNVSADLTLPDYVRINDGERQRRLEFGDVLFTGSSETADEVGMSSVITQHPAEALYLNSFSIGFRPNESNILDPEFAKHLFRSHGMRKQIVRTAQGVTRFNVSKNRLAKVKIPIPDRNEQAKIAMILDRFEALTSSITEGLPAEISARRQQYEYYRDKLLTFEEAEA